MAENRLKSQGHPEPCKPPIPFLVLTDREGREGFRHLHEKQREMDFTSLRETFLTVHTMCCQWTAGN